MEMIKASEARVLSGDRVSILKEKFIQDHEELLSNIFEKIKEACSNLRFNIVYSIDVNSISDLESQIIKMILVDYGYFVEILPNYITLYAFSIRWDE